MDDRESVRAGPEEKNLMLTVHYSNQCGNAKNCLYPYSGTSDNPEDLRAVSYTHLTLPTNSLV